MGNRFDKYIPYIKENGKVTDVNSEAFKLANESFLLFKELFDTDYGSMHEDGNLISIHSGGWYSNEVLIDQFKHTVWWFKYHRITAKGGHYYFNTDPNAEKEWKISLENKNTRAN